jgi:N-acetylneuraminate synthase
MIKAVNIGGRLVGAGEPCFIIAEAGVNHNGDMKLAHQLIDEAKKAGADCVKFQSFVTEELITPDAPKAEYQVVTTGQPGSQHGMLKMLELSAAQQAELKKHCDDAGIIYMCTPYENTSADMLDNIGVAAYKIASTDTTNIPFLRYIASKKRPVIISTGMSTLTEVEEAVNTLNNHGLKDKFVVLHCTSEYPAPMSDINLRAMETMRLAFQCPVGFSDHTPGVGASPWAVVLGACVIEKHFSLDRGLKGPDHRASMEPAELAELVRTVRNVELALGDGVKRIAPSEAANKPRMQKSIVARRDIKKGQSITADLLTCKRPGSGLAPNWLDRVIGQRALRDIKQETLLGMSDIEWSK